MLRNCSIYTISSKFTKIYEDYVLDRFTLATILDI